MPLAVLAALALLLLGLGADRRALWEAGGATQSSSGAVVHADQPWHGLHAAVTLAMALYLAARGWAWMVDPIRRAAFASDAARLAPWWRFGDRAVHADG